MNLPLAEKIANAVLYEGYILYPYRPSAIKNQQRWTFGGVYPLTWSEAQNGSDPWFQQIECLVQADANATLNLKVRFLHLIQREVQVLEDGTYRTVESLRVGEQIFYTWQEAVERAVECKEIELDGLVTTPRRFTFSFVESHESEPVGKNARLVRTQHALEGAVEVAAERVSDIFKLTMRVLNVTPFAVSRETLRDTAVMRSFASTHSISSLQGGAFISLMDPPETVQAQAADCHNSGVYPILVGDAGERDMMLASPIILYDYPEIAPESAGELFDGTEIDEILSLRILTLTDEEKQEARQSDERARAILDRTENLPPEVWSRLHGAMRGLKPMQQQMNASAADEFDFGKWDINGADQEADRVLLQEIMVRGAQVRTGDHVRLKPKPGADAFDILLAGHIATIEAIEQDFENRIYLAVTVDDDPGNDFGRMRQAAHRFFFSPEEVEPL